MQLECNFVLTMRIKLSIDGVQLAMPLNMWPATIHYAHMTAQLYELEVNDAITSNTRYKIQDTRYFISGTKPIVKTY